MALSQDQIMAYLEKADNWEYMDVSIEKTYTLSSFLGALEFVNKVGQLAEAANHHPDILIQYKKVTLTLSTHSEGGLTEKDFNLAAQIDNLPLS